MELREHLFLPSLSAPSSMFSVTCILGMAPMLDPGVSRQDSSSSEPALSHARLNLNKAVSRA